MKKVAIVYWSGTGNTDAMAYAVCDDVKSAGVKAAVYITSEFDVSEIYKVDAITFGCSTIGTEILEGTEFELLSSADKAGLNGKKIALFDFYS